MAYELLPLELYNEMTSKTTERPLVSPVAYEVLPSDTYTETTSKTTEGLIVSQMRT
jgi:hypothetical protein